MKHIAFVLVVFVLSAASASGDDLVYVAVTDHLDAARLSDAPARAIHGTPGGYLVLGDWSDLTARGLEGRLLAEGVDPAELYIGRTRDVAAIEDLSVLYRSDDIVVARFPAAPSPDDPRGTGFFPLRTRPVKVEYVPSRRPAAAIKAFNTILDSLVAEISQDSLESYLDTLQSYMVRLAGTGANYAARDWLYGKFQSFGYDSVSTDTFIGEQLWNRIPVECHNVIAYKEGYLYPDFQVVIGGHFDAVPDCPGADDNASGTAATLEIARVLRETDLPMSVTFIAFDSEESWMWGSYHYVDGAVLRDEKIVLMINVDMIGHETNDYFANVYHGPEDAYAVLWKTLALPLVDISAVLNFSVASDHLPFLEAGYDVIFVQERDFSTHYHLPTDSTTHLNFGYMTRMVKATLATLYSVTIVPPPVPLVDVREPGDGSSQLVVWESMPADGLDHFQLGYYADGHPEQVTTIDIPLTDTSYLVTGLTEGQTYVFYVKAIDIEGMESYAVDEMAGTPYSRPRLPAGVKALPVYHGIKTWWRRNNVELDFDHYAVIRDGAQIAATNDSVYIDSDPSLGSEPHQYHVLAVDTDANASDTAGVPPVTARAARLETGKVLAVNRTAATSTLFSDYAATGRFLRDALAGWDYTYRSDTAYQNPSPSLWLDHLIDYELIVIGAENRGDNLIPSAGNQVLDSLAYYVSMGGKLVIFGRWGMDMNEDTVDYAATPSSYDDYYASVFHTTARSHTAWPFDPSPLVRADLVGAHSLLADYPTLAWDSAACEEMASPVFVLTGVPAVTYPWLGGDGCEIIYTYDARDDNPDHEGKPVAWRYLGDDYGYVWFDIPLTSFDSASAAEALRQAVRDLIGQPTAVDDDSDPGLPYEFALMANYPNPFNPITRIDYTLPRAGEVKLTVYNILGQEVSVLVDGRRPPGRHTVTWNGTDGEGRSVATGIYLYRLETEDHAASRKMLLLK